jgi:long-chain-fatty-acid--[acyl-carrier-protein] ligase
VIQAVRYVFWAMAKLLLSLRYRVWIHGKEQLRGLHGTLVLPNHPAYMDPPLTFTSLWPALQPRPLLFEGNFQNPVLYPLMKLIRAVQVPDMERPSAKARARTEKAIAEVIEGLRKGENHMMWPSGYLWRDGQERLGGAQAVTEILRAVPEANIVLVRTRGLWGSMSSFAPTGERPHFLGCLGRGAAWLVANLLMLTPRRRIDITVERLDRSKLPELRRETLNPWLEQWYNAGGPEKPTFVPYHFLLGRRTFEFPSSAGPAQELSRVSAETRAEVNQILERKLRRKLTDAEQQPDMVLQQLGIDSLDRMDVTLQVEQRFGYSTDRSPANLGDLWLLGQGLAKKATAPPVPRSWFAEPSTAELPQIQGETIAEAFVTRALAHPGDVAVADNQAGALNYRRLLAGALALSRRFAALPGTKVGLLLPASAGCDVAFLALQLAGKVPVVLNWTTGPANLQHAVQLLELRHIATSNLFIDRLDEALVNAIKSTGAQFLCLEDIRAGIGRGEMLRTLLGVRFRPGWVRALVPKVSPEQPAVVLFTSGSEKAPKAVPLTHRNLLSNQRASLSVLGLTSKDSVLGFLPAFHSFGLSVTGLMPLLSGVRVVRYPDPTATATLARMVGTYRPTVLAGTPTFINGILEQAQTRPEQLQSLRLLFVGAEKCPQSLIDRCQKLVPKASLLEGYGITECSPVVSVNPPGANRPGSVGKPLPGVEVRVADMEELSNTLPANTRGMLLVSGPNVFPGYIGKDVESPFRELNGKRWYVTGDLAQLDVDGYIHLAGRLKRFLKVGGEMISLPALEEPFARLYPPTKEGPRVAVEGTETPRRLVLFTTEKISLSTANDLLHQEGFRGIMRLDEVRIMEALPTLGTGKIDTKSLRAML